MYLLDTDWAIQALGRRQPAARILDQLADSSIYICYVSLGELYEQAFWSVNPQAHMLSFQHFLTSYHRLGLIDPIMEWFAELRFYLRRRGQMIQDFDVIIAATALYYDLTLLTFNLSHFQRIPELKLYQPS